MELIGISVFHPSGFRSTLPPTPLHESIAPLGRCSSQPLSLAGLLIFGFPEIHLTAARCFLFWGGVTWHDGRIHKRWVVHNDILSLGTLGQRFILMVQKSSHSYINWLAGFLFRVVRVANLQINGCVFWKLKRNGEVTPWKMGPFGTQTGRSRCLQVLFQTKLTRHWGWDCWHTQLPKDREEGAYVIDWMKILPISTVKHSLKDNTSNDMNISTWM